MVHMPTLHLWYSAARCNLLCTWNSSHHIRTYVRTYVPVALFSLAWVPPCPPVLLPTLLFLPPFFLFFLPSPLPSISLYPSSSLLSSLPFLVHLLPFPHSIPLPLPLSSGASWSSVSPLHGRAPALPTGGPPVPLSPSLPTPRPSRPHTSRLRKRPLMMC